MNWKQISARMRSKIFWKSKRISWTARKSKTKTTNYWWVLRACPLNYLQVFYQACLLNRACSAIRQTRVYALNWKNVPSIDFNVNVMSLKLLVHYVINPPKSLGVHESWFRLFCTPVITYRVKNKKIKINHAKKFMKVTKTYQPPLAEES